MWRNSDLANNGGLGAAAATPTASSSSNSSSTTSTSSTAPRPPPSSASSSIDTMWSFDATRATTPVAASTSSSAAGFARSGAENHGVIGSGNARLLWNRMAPEEEEREEEALPSYLSYLQPAFRPSASDRLASFEDPIRRPPPNLSHPAASSTGTSSSSFAFGASTTATAAATSSSAHYMYNASSSSRAYPMGAMMANDPNTLQVESKSKEFAFALQDFILAQIEQQQQQQP
uniref:Uncharacterized protein n=1 Tax=Globisporangium ultimum (strain ATCC 200006 / CBS 805.95 / DAOM BR144) TaxID=431595 RepID=K3WQQ0_GLOUD